MTYALLLYIVPACVLSGWIGFKVGHHLGKRFVLRATRPIVMRDERMLEALLNLDTWCSSFPHAWLITRHLIAIYNGARLNAGIPNGDEPCTIAGLREQLTRLDK